MQTYREADCGRQGRKSVIQTERKKAEKCRKTERDTEAETQTERQT